MPIDHVDRVVQQWKAERPDYDLAPVEIIGRAGRIMEHVDRALEAKFEEFQISRASVQNFAEFYKGSNDLALNRSDEITFTEAKLKSDPKIKKVQVIRGIEKMEFKLTNSSI